MGLTTHPIHGLVASFGRLMANRKAELRLQTRTAVQATREPHFSNAIHTRTRSQEKGYQSKHIMKEHLHRSSEPRITQTPKSTKLARTDHATTHRLHVCSNSGQSLTGDKDLLTLTGKNHNTNPLTCMTPRREISPFMILSRRTSSM